MSDGEESEMNSGKLLKVDLVGRFDLPYVGAESRTPNQEERMLSQAASVKVDDGSRSCSRRPARGRSVRTARLGHRPWRRRSVLNRR